MKPSRRTGSSSKVVHASPATRKPPALTTAQRKELRHLLARLASIMGTSMMVLLRNMGTRSYDLHKDLLDPDRKHSTRQMIARLVTFAKKTSEVSVAMELFGNVVYMADRAYQYGEFDGFIVRKIEELLEEIVEIEEKL